MTTNSHVTFSFNLLRFSYGGVLLLAGLDKIFATNLITDWAGYLSPAIAEMLPVSVGVFLIGMGIVEVAVAVMLLTKFQRLGAYLSVVWLLLISVDLIMLGMLDIAIRDILLAVGALVLAQLTEALEASSVQRSALA